VPEFLGTAVAEVNVRPRRIAYLVQSGNREQLAKAIAYASTEWGGVMQLILPVDRRGKILRYWRDVCDLLSPESFIDYTGVPEALEAELRSAYGASVQPENQLRHSEPGIHALAALPPGSFDLQLIVPRDDSLLISAILGVVRSEHVPLWEEVGVSFAESRSAVDLLNAQIDALSPIEATRRNIDVFEIQSGTPGGIVLMAVGRATPQQVLNFWNLRALSYPSLGTFVLCLPRSALEEDAVAERVRQLCVERSMTVPDLVLYGHQPGRLQELGEQMGFRPPADKKVSWRFAAREKRSIRERPLTYRVNIPPEVFLGAGRSFGKLVKAPVTIASGQVTLHTESPVRFHPRIGGYVRWEVRGVPHLRWPSSEGVARLIHPDASFSGFGVGVLTSPSKEYGFPLSIPEPESVCTAYLRDHGLTWSLSDKGRYAQALKESIGAEVLARVLGKTRAMTLISALVSLSRRKAEQLLSRARVQRGAAEEILGIVQSTASPRWRGIDELAGTTAIRKRDVASIAAQLVNVGLLRRAFDYRCPRCGLRVAVPLAEATDAVHCAGCRFESVLVAQEDQEPRFLYGLNSLLDRALDQDCVGHVLVGEYLRSKKILVWYAPGANLVDGTGANREVDVLGLSETHVLLAEVKKRAQAFTRNEIRKIIALGKGIPRAKVILASLDDWSREVRESAVQRCASAGLEVTVLGASELLSAP
jgi:hypothetical protein